MLLFDIVLLILSAILLWFVMAIVLLLIVYAKEFKRLWQEPMLRYPFVIFDSDDWGVGPKDQTQALEELLNLFLSYQDRNHRHPRLALGLILAEPDKSRIEASQNEYYYKDLSDKAYTELVAVIKQGYKSHVFDLYLHGMEHYWPASLMHNLHLEEVQSWLFGKIPQITEDLPSFLQSRWCDTSTLPSKPIPDAEIGKAVAQEQACFKKIFEQEAKVIVPPTFVWTEQVINAYLQKNINLFITPGRQFTGRTAEGGLISNGRTFYNGECDSSGACYLVRDIYFEPEKGHKAARVLDDIVDHTACGRPSLIEMHRLNFLQNKSHSLNELKKLLDIISQKLPETLYLTAEQLMGIYKSADKQLLVMKKPERFAIWLIRVKKFLEYKRLSKYSGVNYILEKASPFSTSGRLLLENRSV